MNWLELLLALFFAMGCAPLAFFFPGCLCCGVACTHCTGGTRSAQVQIVISGVFNGASCTTCAALNGTFIADAVAQAATAGTPCNWLAPFSSFCGFTGWTVQRVASLTSVSGGGLFAQIQYGTNAAGAADCSSWSSFNVPFDSASFETQCDGTASTCLITAL
jgi:hypothetical protein